ncbi:hypothetical protein LB941_00285 [Ligilactobacillus sp. WILCCON 0076]|uniref:Uncharacterized protein n=1 Tax=Ligilactobacillus ubinensis TaxID=2876789 RepID=A0A9X2FK26_9LACO|nr:hypothetical protein [Ligilactobacillus ubinensis]MCP0885768.1 hypothetical protein [Ligilactobacillus ubinensis]
MAFIMLIVGIFLRIENYRIGFLFIGLALVLFIVRLVQKIGGKAGKYKGL